MAVLHVIEQGAVLHKRDDLVVVRKNEQLLQTVPLFALDQVLVFGSVSLTAAMRNHLLQHGIDTVFLTRSGRFRGRLTAFSGSNIELRRIQFRRCDDDDFVLRSSKLFVEGKLRNTLALLQRHQRRAKSANIARALHRIRKAQSQLESAQTLDQVRGHEGNAGAAYFGCLCETLKQKEFHFTRRSRRPPKDPFNSLLSFGYTMLLGSVMTAVQTVGLEPYLGFLHSASNGKPSVGLDLMEEFRPILVDAIAIRMVNRRQFEPSDFTYQEVESQDHIPEDDRELTSSDYPVLMGRLSIKKWLLSYHRELEQKLIYPRYGKRLTYKQIILEQARLLARHIKGEEEYRSFQVR